MRPGGRNLHNQALWLVLPAYDDEEPLMRLRALTIVAAVAAMVAVAAPPALASHPPGPARAQLSAQIRYTTGGVPHILAHNWPSLGFGYGYALAQDNLDRKSVV